MVYDSSMTRWVVEVGGPVLECEVSAGSSWQTGPRSLFDEDGGLRWRDRPRNTSFEELGAGSWELVQRDAGTLVYRGMGQERDPAGGRVADLASGAWSWQTTDRVRRCPGPHRSAGVPLGDRVEHMFSRCQGARGDRMWFRFPKTGHCRSALGANSLRCGGGFESQ